MPAIPVPVFDTSYYVIPYDDTPPNTASISLDLTSSVKSDGGTAIAEWKTVIVWQPVGQTATVAGQLTNTPSVTNIDTTVPGTIVVLAVIEDDNPDPALNLSYDSIVPRQNGASPRFGRGAYAGVGPVPSQITYIHVETPTGLIKAGKYQRDWADLCINPLIDRVDQLSAGTGGLLSGIGRFDFLYELTAAHRIRLGNDLEVLPASSVRFKNSSYNEYSRITGNFDANTCFYVEGVTDKNIVLQRWGTLSSSYSKLELVNGAVRISGGIAQEVDLTTDWIQSRSTNGQVTIRGTGTHTADLRVNVIQSDSNNSYVEVKKRGTAAHDLYADDLGCDNLEANTVRGRDPGTFPAFYLNEYKNYTTTGTNYENVCEVEIPPTHRSADGGRYLVETTHFYAANANSKVWRIRVSDGTTTITFADISTTSNNLTAKGVCQIIMAGAGAQISYIETLSSAPVAAIVAGAAGTLDETEPWTFYIDIRTPAGAGDMTLTWASIRHEPAVLQAP